MLNLLRRSREQRRASRKSVGTNAFIRMDGFAVRPCVALDLSDTGVRIAIDGAELVPKVFTFLTSRNAVGRKAAVKWRRGTTLGAEFL
jgi:hypothetical protein